MGLFPKLINKLFGEDSKPVETKFSQNVENVTKILSESINNVNITQNSETSASNSSSLGQIVVSGAKNSSVNYSIKQTSEAVANNEINTLINEIMNVNATSEDKIDCLLNIIQTAESEGELFNSSGAATNVNLDIKNDNEITCIRKLNTALRQTANASASNTFAGEGLIAMGLDNSNVNVSVGQYASARTQQLLNLIQDCNQSLTTEQKAQIIDELNDTQVSKSSGVLTSLVGTFNKSKILIVVAIIVVLVILFGGVILIKSFKKSDVKGGYYDDDL